MSRSGLVSVLMLRSLASTLGEMAAERKLQNVVCPTDCVLASFSFLAAATECASCTPEFSKYRCPATANRYEHAMEGTFPGGFKVSAWDADAHCSHETYTPSFLAFAGPGAWEDDITKACPKAEFCACGPVKEKIIQLLFDREKLSKVEKSDLYWAAQASGFTLVKGFTGVVGGSVEHYDLIYEHGDGRRQFCSGVQSFTYSPQQVSGDLTHSPVEYFTDYAVRPSCDEGYKSVKTEWYCSSQINPNCHWSRLQCRAEQTGLGSVSSYPDQAATEHFAPTQAANVEPLWTSWVAWSSCDKKCGGGSQKRSRQCLAGSGTFLNSQCADGLAPAAETQSCNEQECSTYTTACEWFPSCDSGDEQMSSEYCGSGWSDYRKQKTCRDIV